MEQVVYLKKFVRYLKDLSTELEEDEDFQEILEKNVDNMAKLKEAAKDLRNQSQETYGDVKSFVGGIVTEEGVLNEKTQPVLEGEEFEILCRNNASSSVDRSKIESQVKRQLFNFVKDELNDVLNDFHMTDDMSLEDAVEDVLDRFKEELSNVLEDLLFECVKSNGMKIGGIRDMESKDENDEGLRLSGVVSKPDTSEVNHLEDPSFVDVKEREVPKESDEDFVMEEGDEE